MEITKYNSQLPAKLEDLTRFVLIGRERLTAVRAEMRARKKIGFDTEEAQNLYKLRMTETQDMADELLDAECLLGEILKSRSTSTYKKGGEKNLPEDITKFQSIAFQKLAGNKDIVEQVKAEAIKNDDLPTRTEVLRKIKEKEKDSRIEVEKKSRGKSIADIDIRKGDFKKVLADVYDIDFILTDPPFPEQYLNCFSELSKYASEHLKKDGFVAVYSGHVHIPEVIKRLSEHLTYVWTFCLYHVGKKQLFVPMNIMVGWKPVFIFSRGRKKMRFPAYDVLISESREKHSHEWQQSESGASQLIEIFSKSGDLIVDPFSGSGTFGVVSINKSRRFIGSDLVVDK